MGIRTLQKLPWCCNCRRPQKKRDLTNKEVVNYRKVADEFYGNNEEVLFDLSHYCKENKSKDLS